MGAIVVVSDAWCDVSIDGGPAVRNARQPFRVAAGHHTVVCAQSADRRWSLDVDVKPGETTTARGQLLATVEVTLGIAAAIDGIAHRAGEKVQLRAGRHELTAGAQHQFITVKIPCVVRDKPSLDCY
jgi:uncharacterized protein (DUF2345 family)